MVSPAPPLPPHPPAHICTDLSAQPLGRHRLSERSPQAAELHASPLPARAQLPPPMHRSAALCLPHGSIAWTASQSRKGARASHRAAPKRVIHRSKPRITSTPGWLHHGCSRNRTAGPDHSETGGRAGGAKGSRTPDLLNAIQALSQLSYGPGTQRSWRGRRYSGARRDRQALPPPPRRSYPRPNIVPRTKGGVPSPCERCFPTRARPSPGCSATA